MYETFYGFREKPFSLLPDPEFLYYSKKHQMALTMLQYGLVNRASITVITGEVGSGKTTLIRQLLNEIEDEITVGLISNTHQSFGELMQWVLMAFKLDHKDKDKAALYETFVDFVIQEYANSRRTVLIIDEAQNMAPETLEELRMLSNVNADKDQVLQLILVGQPELRSTLGRPDLLQFAQRVSSSYHLGELTLEETHKYIQHRLNVAGGNKELFDKEACDAVYKHSGGTPRLINVICDTALVYGYAEQDQAIDSSLIEEVVLEKQKGGIFPATTKHIADDEEGESIPETKANIVEKPPARKIKKNCG